MLQHEQLRPAQAQVHVWARRRGAISFPAKNSETILQLDVNEISISTLNTEASRLSYSQADMERKMLLRLSKYIFYRLWDVLSKQKSKRRRWRTGIGLYEANIKATPHVKPC